MSPALRTAAAALLVVLAGASDARAEQRLSTIQLFAGAGFTQGNAAVGGLAHPFDQKAYDFGMEIEFDTGERTALGLPIGLRAAMVFGYAPEPVIEAVPTPEFPVNPVPMHFMMSAGTLLPLYDRGPLQVRMHVSGDFWVIRPSWTNDTMVMSVYGGARATYVTDSLRLRLHLDLRPFWFGTDRLEYEATVGASKGSYGARATVTLGEERRPEGGYRDRTLFGAFEVTF